MSETADVIIEMRPATAPRSAVPCAPWAVLWLMLAGAAVAGLGTARAQTPPAGGWVPVAPNSTAVARSTDAAAAANGVPVALSAVLTDDGQPIDQGMVWHIFRDSPGSDGKRPLVRQIREALPRLKLEPGDYLVNAAFGRATLTRKITVAAGAQVSEKFVLNAGGLRMKAVLASGEPAPDKSVAYDIMTEERDQSGNRVKVIVGARPGLIIRLNAGVYQVVSTYGDANARVRSEITIEPGKLTDAILSHTGSKMTFKLVAQAGGEALADVAWMIVNAKAETVKEAVGALPTHILAAGRYAVVARHQGRTYRAEFAAKPGEAAVVEVVAK